MTDGGTKIYIPPHSAGKKYLREEKCKQRGSVFVISCFPERHRCLNLRESLLKAPKYRESKSFS